MSEKLNTPHTRTDTEKGVCFIFSERVWRNEKALVSQIFDYDVTTGFDFGNWFKYRGFTEGV